ncbi:MAG: TonB-dependent receptor [Burkholderiales bacterium]
MKFQRKKVAVAVAMLAGGALSAFVSAPAVAQTPTTTPSGQPIRVEVTGTNIRRVDSETTSPVQVITQEEMVRQGYTSIQEVIRDITANNQGLLSNGFPGAFAQGGQGVALRGLGVGASLVLIDGLRMSPFPRPDDNQHNFVDISAIPFTAVERIEVLLDGASAIYGSDAIGGVLNVILKKNFTGSSLVLDGGSTTKGGGTTWHASIMQGFGKPTDTVNGYLNFEYRHQDRITYNQRSGQWLTQDWSNYTEAGGVNYTPGARSPGVVNNPLLLTPYLQKPGANSNLPENNIFLTNGCNLAARNANQCTFEDTWSTIAPETENINVIGRANIKIGQNWDLVLTGSWFRAEVETVRRQTGVPGAFGGNTAFGINVAPFISPAITPYTVPATYPGNTFGVPAVARAILPDTSARTNNSQADTTRLVAELTGSALGFDWNVSAGYTAVNQTYTQNGYVNPYALYAALNDPVNPFKLTGGNSQQVMGIVAPTVKTGADAELDFLQFVATRDLMKLDGGPLAMAVGAGAVYLHQYADTPTQFQNGTVTGLFPAYTSGSQTNTNFYVEFVAPVLKTLELDAAVRYDYYNTYGGDWTPKVGFKWVPIKEVGFRGTWGQGFRAPGPAESGKSGTAYGFNNIRDPLLCPVSNANGSPNLTSPQNVPAFCSFGPTYLQVSNPDVKAEKSTNWTIGVILEPVPKWLTTFDYYSIVLKDQIIPAAQTPTYDPIANAVRGPIQEVTYGDGRLGPSTVGPIAYSNVPLINAGKTSTTGLDLASSYTWTLPDTSKLMAGIQWSHLFTWDLETNGVTYKLAGTHGPTILTGNTGTPKDRFQATLQWAKGPFTATLTGNYVGKYDVTDPSAGLNTCEEGISNGYPGNPRFLDVPPTQFCTIDSFWYVNLNLQYQVNKELMVQFSGTNIFNQKPPVDVATYGGAGANLNNPVGAAYNPSFHMPGVIGPTWSLGLQWNFDAMNLMKM